MSDTENKLSNMYCGITYEKIYELYKMGLIYGDIAVQISRKSGQIASPTVVEQIIKKVEAYMNNGGQETKTCFKKEKIGRKPPLNTEKIKELFEELIYDLKIYGCSYDLIAVIFREKGIFVSSTIIKKIYKQYIREKNKEDCINSERGENLKENGLNLFEEYLKKLYANEATKEKLEKLGISESSFKNMSNNEEQER